MDAEKVYCCEKPNDTALTMAMLNGGGMNGWNNNPFVYLVWMMMMRYMNGWGSNEGENYNSRQIAQLQDTVNTNNNNQLALQAINGNSDAIRELASNMNCSFSQVNQAVCGVKSAIDLVSGQVGYSAESVKNAILLGDQNITSKMCECCCQTKTAILEQGYQNQLATERQTGIIGSKIDDFKASNQLQNCQNHGAVMSRIDQLANGIQTGFAQIGFQMSQDTAAIKQNATENTQRILDTLNNRWFTETSNALQDSKAEVSQLKQTQAILSAINNGGCCHC